MMYVYNGKKLHNIIFVTESPTFLVLVIVCLIIIMSYLNVNAYSKPSLQSLSVCHSICNVDIFEFIYLFKLHLCLVFIYKSYISNTL